MEVGAEQGGQGPFVVGCAVEGLVEGGGDEGFEDEEAAEVDAEVRVEMCKNKSEDEGKREGVE